MPRLVSPCLGIFFMKYLIFTIFFLLLSSCSMVNQRLGLEDDNLGEECLEFIIKEKLGPDIDLTPSSPEN